MLPLSSFFICTSRILQTFFELDDGSHAQWNGKLLSRQMERIRFRINIVSNGSFFLHPENFAKKFFEFDDGSSLELLDRIPFSVYISNISQKFLNF